MWIYDKCSAIRRCGVAIARLVGRSRKRAGVGVSALSLKLLTCAAVGARRSGRICRFAPWQPMISSRTCVSRWEADRVLSRAALLDQAHVVVRAGDEVEGRLVGSANCELPVCLASVSMSMCPFLLMCMCVCVCCIFLSLPCPRGCVPARACCSSSSTLAAKRCLLLGVAAGTRFRSCSRPVVQNVVARRSVSASTGSLSVGSGHVSTRCFYLDRGRACSESVLTGGKHLVMFQAVVSCKIRGARTKLRVDHTIHRVHHDDDPSKVVCCVPPRIWGG